MIYRVVESLACLDCQCCVPNRSSQATTAVGRRLLETQTVCNKKKLPLSGAEKNASANTASATIGLLWVKLIYMLLIACIYSICSTLIHKVYIYMLSGSPLCRCQWTSCVTSSPAPWALARQTRFWMSWLWRVWLNTSRVENVSRSGFIFLQSMVQACKDTALVHWFVFLCISTGKNILCMVGAGISTCEYWSLSGKNLTCIKTWHVV